MSSGGGNVVQKFNENPYFDGVISPITTQGEVTVNCRADNAEIAQRRANMGKDNTRAVSYPGGDVLDNLQIYPFELVFGWLNKQGRNTIPGHPNQVGFSSLNGVQWGAFSTNEDLALRLRFICLAKTPYLFENISQLKHGFSGIAVGSGTTPHTGEYEIFPGDPVEWDVVARPSEPGRPLPGGRFGDDGPGSRQGNPRVGTPRGKIRFRINPSRFNDMRPSINAALSCLRKTAAQGGMADRAFEHLFSDPRRGNFSKPTPAVEHAMALFIPNAVIGCATVAYCVRNDIVQYTDNARTIGVNSEVKLAEWFGVFEDKAEKRARFFDLMDSLYLNFSANRERSRPHAERLRATIPQGFHLTKNAVVRSETLESRYVQVRTNLANLQELGFARAVNAVTRRRLGTALSYAKPGQGVDLLLGHFLQSY